MFTNKYIYEKYLLNKSEINNNKTILGNLKNNIIKQLTNNINQNNISKSINLAIELHLSGYFELLLNKLLNFYINEINLNQPLGNIYLVEIIDYYDEVYSKCKQDNFMLISNDIKIRNFICFFITFCCCSNKRKMPKLITTKNTDFNLIEKKKELVSKNLILVSKYLKKNDPKEIKIPLSEIINLLSNSNIKDREHMIIYWLSWIFNYEQNFHNKNLKVSYRNISYIDNKLCNDFVWIIWHMILDQTSDSHKFIQLKLLELFKYKFNKSVRKTKLNILIYAILVCINPVPKIIEPLEISNEILVRCNLESLKSNDEYVKILNQI